MLLRQEILEERTIMIIPVSGVESLADYERRREYLDKNIRPVVCPGCRKENRFWRHGKYARKVMEGSKCTLVHINRFKCGSCSLVVSLVFSFLVPYARFCAAVISKAVQNFSEIESSYTQQASDLADLSTDAPPRPSAAQIFKWVARLAEKSQSLLFQLQKEIVMRNATQLFDEACGCVSPNRKAARTDYKKQLLLHLSEFVQLSRIFTQNIPEGFHRIHAFFLSEVESLQAIFCGRSLRLPTTHY
jgi:hypothetical protein